MARERMGSEADQTGAALAARLPRRGAERRRTAPSQIGGGPGVQAFKSVRSEFG
jgi:hypothetical protein